MTNITDWLDANFKYEGDTYPGSKQKRDPEPDYTPVVEPKAWDSHPFTKVVKGEVREFFTIDALCTGLDRPAVTIRLWIRKGYIPDATYRMPKRVAEDGTVYKGRRLYTREQVEAVLKAFESRNIRHNVRVTWTKHHPELALEIVNAWNGLKAAT